MKKNHVDALAHMSDNEVDRLYRKINNKLYGLRKSLKSKNSAGMISEIKNEEIEYCYVYRETETRKSRQQAHQEYLFSLKNK